MNKLSWYFNRLRSMNLPEVFYRVQQAASVIIEKQLNYPTKINLLAADEAWEAFNSEKAPPFFFSSKDKKNILSLYHQHFELGKKETVSIANDLLDNKIILFGQPFQLSEKNMWYQDPLTKRVWPKDQFWGDIDIRDGHSIGGVKWVWELNRHQHIVTLAKAYFLTENQAYAQKACHLLNSWIDENPPRKGVNWTSSLELGLRIINWSWVLAFLRSSDALTLILFEKIIECIVAQATHISRHLSKFSSANNHLVGEAAGLAFAGLCFPWLPEADHWGDLGLAIMAHELPLQILEDGVPAEQATQYFTFLLDFNLHVWKLAELNHLSVPKAWLERTSKVMQFFQSMITKGGKWIPIGDSDNAWVVRLDELGEKTRLTSFLASFALLQKESPPHLDEKSFWIFGKKAVDVTEKKNDFVTSRFFPTGGYAVMRHEDVLATIDCGPLGYLSTAAHGHADALSIAIMVKERPLLIDPNTFAFQEGYKWRNYFRSSSAHNTIVVDHLDQSEMLGSFLWGKRAEAKALFWQTTDNYSSFVGEHNGYEAIGVAHRRAVIFKNPNLFFIFDHLKGDGDHHFEQLWHFGSQATVTQNDSYFKITCDTVRAKILVENINEYGVKIIEGQEEPPQGWDSPIYGTKQPAPVISLSETKKFPLSIKTIIVLGEQTEQSFNDYMAQITDEIYQTLWEHLAD